MLKDGKIAPLDEVNKLYPAQFEQAKAIPWQPVYLCDAQPQGWRGTDSFYVLYCDECDAFSVTYPNGYAQRIHCRKCSSYTKRDDTVDPRVPSIWRLLGRLIWLRFRLAFGASEPTRPRLPK